MEDKNLIVGFEKSDDAAVYKLTEDLAIIQTLDFFTPMTDDPYIFGQIAAANSLSDVYAMGGQPKTAMNIVCFPQKMDIKILGEILRGGAEKVMEAGAVLSGGHSIHDPEVKYGLSVTGIAHPDKILKNHGCENGDILICTKKLGTGIVTTASKVNLASKEAIDESVKQMTTLNKYAAEIIVNYPITACTDITGFGFLGHAYEMVKSDKKWALLDAVSSNHVYKIPSVPYSFVDAPPALNRLIGIDWLSKLLYPEENKDLDVKERVREFYRLLYNYDLSGEELDEILEGSL